MTIGINSELSSVECVQGTYDKTPRSTLFPDFRGTYFNPLDEGNMITDANLLSLSTLASKLR